MALASLVGCGEGVQADVALDGALHRMERRAQAAPLPARGAILDSLFAAYEAAYPPVGERGERNARLPADTIMARAYARLAYTRWAQGDTTGAVEAYEDGLVYFFLLPDSLRMDRLRRVGYTAGLVDPGRGFRWLDAIERESRARGLNDAAELAAHCKLDLIRRLDSLGVAVPAMEPVGQHGGGAGGYPFLLYALLAYAGVVISGVAGWHVGRLLRKKKGAR